MSGGRTAVSRLNDRLNSLEMLLQTGAGHTVEQANQALLKAYAAGPQPDSILIRQGFVRRRQAIYGLADRDRVARPKPPLATLVPTRGLTLKMELLLLFLNQASARVSSRVQHPISSTDSDEVSLVDCVAAVTRQRGDPSYRRTSEAMRRRQVRNALTRLAGDDLQLVDLQARANENPTAGIVRLQREEGPQGYRDVERYTVPRSTNVISVPVDFFTKGWVQVLTESEIAAWLMYRTEGKMNSYSISTVPDTLTVPAGRRLGVYDLTPDVWETHKVLCATGLLSVSEGERSFDHESPGKPRITSTPHLFGVTDAGLVAGPRYSLDTALLQLKDEAIERAGS